MDRGTWQARVHGGHKRVRHDLVTKYIYIYIHTHTHTHTTLDPSQKAEK